MLNKGPISPVISELLFSILAVYFRWWFPIIYAGPNNFSPWPAYVTLHQRTSYVAGRAARPLVSALDDEVAFYQSISFVDSTNKSL